MKIDKSIIDENNEPYIIAELSANHCGSIKKALKTIKSAKLNGADAIKIQSYTPDSMTLDCNKDDFLIKEGNWKGYKLYDLYKEACTPYEWHRELFNYAKKLDITIFSTPFDEKAVDLLEELDVPAFKIASFEIIDLPLIKYVASKGKPLLISTGMASENEICEAVKVSKDYGCGDVLLFHCISDYPASTKNSNINLIRTIKDKFDVEVGLSDHTLNNTSALAAISLGAVAIEKHFILDRQQKGPDSAFSIEPKELKELKFLTKECWQAMGSGEFLRSTSELKNKVFRRSLYFVKDMEMGQLITQKDIRRLRPGYGIPPKYIDQVINRRLKISVERGDRVSWDCLEEIS